MTEPRRFQSITGRLELKVPSMTDWGVAKRQMALYAGAINYEAIHQAEEALLQHYASEDAAFTPSTRWNKIYGPPLPVLINKLRGRANQTLFSLNDLIHPGTIERMTPPRLRQGAFSIYDWEAPGCGCVR